MGIKLIDKIIKILINFKYNKESFEVWSWGIDDIHEINILSAEYYNDHYRYGTREEYYKAEEREQIPDLRETAEEAAEAIQNLTKAGISQEDIESSDLTFYDADTRRIRISKPENIQKLKEYAEWLPQYEGELVAESEDKE